MHNPSQTKYNYHNISFILILFMFLPLIFDFKSNSSSSKNIVILFSLISIFSSFILLIYFRYINKYSIKLVLVFIIFIIFSNFNSLIRYDDIFSLIALDIPLILFIMATIIISSVDYYIKDLNKVILMLLYFIVSSVIIKVIIGFNLYELTLSSVRFQILSPLLPLLFSYGIASIFYKKQKIYIFALILSVSVVFISVTRSYILIYLSIIIFWLAIIPFKIEKKFFYKALKYILIFSILLVFLYSFFPEVFDRWIYRIFINKQEHNNMDVTLYTRIAEMSYQINKLLENNFNFLFGLGLNAKTEFANEYISLLKYAFARGYVFEGRAYGHNTYVGIIFISGIIIGSVVILYLIVTFLKLFLFTKKIFKQKNIEKNNEIFILAWGTSSILGYIIHGLYAGTFGDRVSSLGFGIAFGLAFLAKKRLLQNDI